MTRLARQSVFRSILGLTLFLTILPPAWVKEGAEGKIVWRRNVLSKILNEPALIDVNADGKPEIVVTDIDGSAAAIHADTGKVFWSRRISHTGLTPPLPGAFLSDGAIDIAVADFDGNFYLLAGGTGQVLTETKVGPLVSKPMTLAPLPSPDGVLRDSVIAVTGYGGILQVVFESNPVAGVLRWANDRCGGVSFPPAASRKFRRITAVPDEETTACVALGTPLARIHILDAGTGRELKARPRDGDEGFVTEGRRGVNSPLAVGDLNGDGLYDIVYGDKDGRILALDNARGVLSVDPRWGESRPLTSLRSILLGDFVTAGSLDILVAQEDGFLVLDAGGAPKLYEPSVHPVSSDFSLIPPATPGGWNLIVFSDNYNVLYVYRLDPSVTSGTRASVAFSAQLSFIPGPTLLVGDADGDDRAEIYGTRSDENQVFCLATNVPFPFGAPSWCGPNGQPYRTNWLDKEYYRRMEAQQKAIRQKLDGVLSVAQDKYNDGDYEGAAAAAEKALSWNPANREAGRLLLWAKIGRHFMELALALLAAISIVVLAIYKTAFLLWQRRLLKRAGQLENQEQYEEALEIFLRLYRRRPDNKPIRGRLAELMIFLDYLKEDGVPVLEAAMADNPDDREIQNGLARAYMANHRTHEKAMALYESTRRHYEPRWEIEQFMGVAYMRQGETQLAIARLADAVRYGCAEQETLEDLARLYIETKQFTADSAPVFERVVRAIGQIPGSSARPFSDLELLEALCLAYLAARRTDQEARTAYERLVESEPRHVPVLARLAAIALSDGDPERAQTLARRVLAVEEDNVEGLALLAHSLVALGREDEETVAILERATEANPLEKALLRALAHAYIDIHRTDPPAVAVLKKARGEYPEDVTLNIAVADAAEREGDRAVLIQALEQLVEIGQQKKDILTRLAVAYKAEGVTEPKAQRPYELAREAFPDDLEFCRLLGTIYAREGRLDGKTVETIEPLIEIDEETGDLSASTPLDLAIHLARAYHATDHNEDALRLLEELARVRPDDTELMRMLAEARLLANRLEDAIEKYRQIIERNPNDPQALANCAVALNQLQRVDAEALDIYRRALAVNPGHPGVLRAIARVHAAQGNLPESVKALRQVVKSQPELRSQIIEDCQALLGRHPDSPDLHWFLAQSLIAVGRFNEAIDALQRLYELNPAVSRTIIKAYEQILSRDTRNVRAHLGAGILYRAEGRMGLARQSLEQASCIMPNNADVQAELIDLYEAFLRERDDTETRFKLGEVYYRSGHYDESIACFQRCARDYRYEKEGAKMLGLAFAGKGMLDMAFNELKKLPIDDEMKEILYSLAGKFQEKGDLVGAKNVYRVLFAADIGFRDVKEKFEMLAGTTSDPMVFEKTTILNTLSESARRRYILEDELGRGAMGIVYRALDNELEETVALKILPDDLSSNLEAVARFRAEARSARRLTHPNIVRIHDIGEEMGRKYISMEYVKGSDLKKLARGKKLPPVQALSITRAIADALDYAHQMGIVHRDIKPANILISEDKVVKITDFGIAKAKQSSESTQAGAVLGTPLYMSPEQAKGQVSDLRCDIYSLGVVLYEMLAGAPPFTGGNLAEQHLSSPPPPLQGVPEDVSKIVMKCLAKNPDDRYEHASQLRDAIDVALIRGLET